MKLSSHPHSGMVSYQEFIGKMYEMILHVLAQASDQMESLFKEQERQGVVRRMKKMVNEVNARTNKIRPSDFWLNARTRQETTDLMLLPEPKLLCN